MIAAMPPQARTETRERLLDAAQDLINRQGFAATSVDQILERVGLTKGAFFHHFPTKHDLARALIDRFAAADGELLRSSMERAERLSDEPLQQVLIFVGLMIEAAEALDASPHPGCLFATYCYESGLFEDETTGVIADAMLAWRALLGDKLRAAARERPLPDDIDVESLADMLTVLFEGAFVMARTFPRRAVFTEQLRHYRRYLRLLFSA